MSEIQNPKEILNSNYQMFETAELPWYRLIDTLFWSFEFLLFEIARPVKLRVSINNYIYYPCMVLVEMRVIHSII